MLVMPWRPKGVPLRVSPPPCGLLLHGPQGFQQGGAAAAERCPPGLKTQTGRGDWGCSERGGGETAKSKSKTSGLRGRRREGRKRKGGGRGGGQWIIRSATLLQAHMEVISQGKANRNKRRSLRRQISRLNEALQAVNMGCDRGGRVGAAEEALCRCCGLRDCGGGCWGFHGRRKATHSSVARRRLLGGAGRTCRSACSSSDVAGSVQQEILPFPRSSFSPLHLLVRLLSPPLLLPQLLVSGHCSPPPLRSSLRSRRPWPHSCWVLPQCEAHLNAAPSFDAEMPPLLPGSQTKKHRRPMRSSDVYSRRLVVSAGVCKRFRSKSPSLLITRFIRIEPASQLTAVNRSIWCRGASSPFPAQTL